MRLLSSISVAIDRTSGSLFQPFDPAKWFTLGFSAWLASFLLYSSSSFGGSSYDGKGASASADSVAQTPVEPSGTWTGFIDLGWPVRLAIAAGLFLLVMGLYALFLWLGCRGQFMLLDNVLRNRDEVRAPWRTFKAAGNSLFRLYLIVYLGMGLLAFLLFAYGLLFCWPDLVAQKARPFSAYWPLLAAVLGLFFLWIPLAIGLFFIREFGVLWMYRNGGTVWQAVGRLGHLALEHAADFVLYLLTRIGIAVVFAIIAVLMGCLTCCIGFLPYISTVLTLPLSVFRVWYSVECFAALGEDCDVRSFIVPPLPLTPPPVPPAA